MVDRYSNEINYFYIFVHESYETRFDMADVQKVAVGYEEDILVSFEKTNLKKINSEASKCNDTEAFFGHDHCMFIQVKYKI